MCNVRTYMYRACKCVWIDFTPHASYASAYVRANYKVMLAVSPPHKIYQKKLATLCGGLTTGRSCNANFSFMTILGLFLLCRILFQSHSNAYTLKFCF